MKGDRTKTTICTALEHPLRIRILEIVNEIPMSPSRFVDQGYMPGLYLKTYQQALSLVSYHFRELEKAGCIEVFHQSRGGATVATVYAGLNLKKVPEDERRDLTADERREFSRLSMQGLIARADSAMREGTFDRRPDRRLEWSTLTLDDDDWAKVQTILTNAQEQIEALRQEASDKPDGKLSENVQTEVTIGLLAFECCSTEPKPLRPRDRR